VIVICPKCKIKLKVDNTKISPQGTRFKCPKCSVTLLVKKPAAPVKKDLDKKTVLVAHGDPAISERIQSILTSEGYRVLVSSDGIDAMVQASKEYPFLSVVDVALPKIFGFELCKRFKTRAETKDMKCILITSVHDKTKYRREPSSLYDADAYIEEHNISHDLTGALNRLISLPKEDVEKPASPPLDSVGIQNTGVAGKTAPQVEQPPPEKSVLPEQSGTDIETEKAARLARTIINDIHLYNTERVEKSIADDSFYSEFESELKEGLKLYENRIPDEVRQKGDFYNEAIDTFITKKKQQIV
jgi:predicted Zn finger-like uncharacterized protein